MKVFYDEKTRLPGEKPIKSWCMNPEEGALSQAINLARLPFLFRHVALMPDTHQGYGMPIGGVVALEKVIIPNAVGVDIGCGMLAVKTSLTEITTEELKQIMGKIRGVVPVGFNHQKQFQNEELMPQSGLIIDNATIVCKEYTPARKQLGTLGGGNHFIEIQKGSDGHIWFMVHSGSRNLGFKVAEHYVDLAYNLNQKWHANTYLPKDKKQSLAFLPMDSKEGQMYLEEMQYCLDFALANRKLMANNIKNCFGEVMGYDLIDFVEEINIHHNYAKWENHFGKNVIIHRKGATSARDGEIGLIPGSQGTASYVVRGKGNKESFTSCSHGAGRKMGREEAKKTLDLIAEQKRLDDRGIIHSVRNKEDLDEASGSYKDIDVVMAEQTDLVDIVVKLEPLGVIKG